ncbi:MAG: AI-2E family transporter [Fulvimarina manganoxydans]|uniref:AI-2E family transporter n=1 Tax=Fulvimarina manganoxydans TaxID=937218 RepID=UPI002357E243|nr:AI-2E family transporter [Fulvimarina manganoxydans]MCK5934698.1 AI-2E family transporter [Fulvimarina manganoxydans]
MNSTSNLELARKSAVVSLTAALIVGLLVVAWLAAPAILLIFGGALLAAIFEALARPLQWAGIRRGLASTIVVLLFFAAIFGAIFYGGVKLVSDFNNLWSQLQGELNSLADMLRETGLQIAPDSEGKPGLQALLPDPSGIFSSASQAVFSVLGGLGNVFVVVAVALFLIAQPALYARGLVSLFPKAMRPRIAETIKGAAEELILWVCGTGISMATVFVVTWIGLVLVGMPSAFLLAFQAGLLAFIPTLGPFIAGIPIVLVGMSESMTMALWGVGVYALVQTVESNLSQPIAQRYTSALPPVLTIGAQIVFGVLLGTLGIVFAVPLVAVLLVFVRNLYVEDMLGGPAGGDHVTGSEGDEVIAEVMPMDEAGPSEGRDRQSER